MRILLIGDANSIWVKDYCDRVLAQVGYDITISTHRNERFRSFYDSRHITVIDQAWGGREKTLIDRAILFLREVMSIRRREYDLIHVHYGSRYNLRLTLFLKGKVIVTFWGSDLLRSSAANRREISLYLRRADKIVVLTEKMRDILTGDEHLRRFHNAISVFDFGISNLESIKKLMDIGSDTSAKDRYSIPRDMTVISVGYNKSEAQRHNDVLKALHRVSGVLLKNVFFIFHMSYGECSEEYYDEMISLIKSLGCGYTIINDFLQGEDLAYIRLATDLYINAQTTDSLAATINEYLYAGKIVMNPGWINYKELDDIGATYIKYDSFEDLPECVTDCLEGRITSVDTETNKRVIWDNYSWDARKEDWIRLYE